MFNFSTRILSEKVMVLKQQLRNLLDIVVTATLCRPATPGVVFDVFSSIPSENIRMGKCLVPISCIYHNTGRKHYEIVVVIIIVLCFQLSAYLKCLVIMQYACFI